MKTPLPALLVCLLSLTPTGCSEDSSTEDPGGAGGDEGFAGASGQGGAGQGGQGGKAASAGQGGHGGQAGASGPGGGAGTAGKGGTGGVSGQGGAGAAGKSGSPGGAGSGQSGNGQAGSGQAGSGGMGAGGDTCSPAISSPEDMQTAHPKGSTCAKLGYYDYLPAGYGAKSGWPLLIAFHGDGERGNGTTDLPLLLNNGLTRDIPEGKWDPQKRFVVLAPQMDDRDGKTERTGGSVRDFISFAKANYAIDPKRIYLTGLSGGGEPVYNYLGDFAGGEVAATNINAGWYSTQGKECSWKDIPIWYFHAAMDGTVPPAQHTTISYNNLVACSPDPAVAPRYTMYLNLGHSAWVPTYDLTGMDANNYPLVSSPPGTTPYDISLYDWFLQYSR